MGAAIGMDTDELFNDEDLDYTCQTSGLRSHGGKATAGSTSRNHMVGQVLASKLWFNSTLLNLSCVLVLKLVILKMLKKKMWKFASE